MHGVGGGTLPRSRRVLERHRRGPATRRGPPGRSRRIPRGRPRGRNRRRRPRRRRRRRRRVRTRACRAARWPACGVSPRGTCSDTGSYFWIHWRRRCRIVAGLGV